MGHGSEEENVADRRAAHMRLLAKDLSKRFVMTAIVAKASTALR
jgi:hypothetical protein